MLAVDSLQKENIQAEVFVYDTKVGNADSLLDNLKQQNASLIIASLNNPDEQKMFSNFALANHIPLISATYPNDAGVSENPFFIKVNPTLQTHVEAIYKYVRKYYSKYKILFITKNGFLEDKIKTTFSLSNQITNPLQYRLAELPDNFTIDDLSPFLDSTKQNIIICGSLNESFATNIFQTINNAKIYKSTIIGMPDWDGIKEINKPQTNTNTSIIYSTSYNFFQNDSLVKKIGSLYKNKTSGKPSDMVYKGFEMMYHFTHLLEKYSADFLNHLSDKDFSLFDNYNFEPAKMNNSTTVPDYFENKNLYFVKKLNGNIISITQLSN